MDALVDWLLTYGYWGMFLAAFLAGSFFPFSSEAVMTALTLTGLDVWWLMAYSTAGNTLGGMFNYGVGALGKEEWIYRFFRVREDRMQKARQLIVTHGAWMGLLSWLPILGSVITIVMGMLHIPVGKALFFIFTGKFLRYFVLCFLLTPFAE